MSIAPVTHHHRVTVDGVDTFYRQAGPPDPSRPGRTRARRGPRHPER
ncbi:hypothetical protein [Mycobacterium lehmannii]|nr:hypothetical protein [Mycobacterium lehmannii]